MITRNQKPFTVRVARPGASYRTFTAGLACILLTTVLAGCVAGNDAGPNQATSLAPYPAPVNQPINQIAAPQPRPVPQTAPQPVAQSRQAALLLPLSGAQATVGHALNNAALLAVQDLAPPNFELKVYDTAKGAQAAFAKARQAGAELIIGPLFSADVQAIRGTATAAGVPVLALSNDVSLAGQGVYVTGFWPGAQVARVVSYAARHGTSRLAALVPDDAYGQLVMSALQQAQVRQIVPIRYTAGSAPATVATQLAAQRGQYDTLLLAESAPRSVALLDALRTQNLLTQANGQPVQLLGSGQWDSARDNMKDMPELAGQTAFLGAWYAAPDPSARASFESRYRQLFGEAPPRIASLAYDATALAAVLAAHSWPYTSQYLVQNQGFAGIDGLFRLRPEGLAERGLAILQFEPTGPRLIDAAPRQF